MAHIEYRNPKTNLERGDDPRHTFELTNDDGVTIGGAEIDYFSSPVPYYQVTDIWVDPEHQGQRLGSMLMDKIEEKLRKTGRAGFLVDAIFDDSPARGMYARRDWIPVPGGRDQFVFNLPKDVDPARFVGVEYRQTPIEDRAGN